MSFQLIVQLLEEYANSQIDIGAFDGEFPQGLDTLICESDKRRTKLLAAIQREAGYNFVLKQEIRVLTRMNESKSQELSFLRKKLNGMASGEIQESTGES